MESILMRPTRLQPHPIDCHVSDPAAERRTVAEALGIAVWDNIAHGGQIAYSRGYFLGDGIALRHVLR